MVSNGTVRKATSQTSPGQALTIARFAEEITSMDGQRFDAWTRVLTRGLSRRGTLKTVAAVALAGMTSRTTVREADANPGTCLEYGDVCSPGQCCGLCCRAGNPSSICADCLPDGQWCYHWDDCASRVCEWSWWSLAYVCGQSGGGGGGNKKKAKCDGKGCNKKNKKRGRGGGRH